MTTAVPMRPGGTRRLHLLQVVGNAIVGGMESYVLRLVERLPAERFQVSALLPYESEVTRQLRGLGVEVFVTPMPEDLPWASIRSAVALVESAGVDVLHAHMPNAHQLAALAGALTGRPVLTTIHARELTLLDVELQRLAGTQVGVVCRHSWCQAVALGIEPSQVVCIPNGVDGQAFRPLPRSAGGGLLRRALGLDEEVPLAAFVGRLSPEKGPDVFLQAALRLASRDPRAHFAFVGAGPMQAELATAARAAGLARRVHFPGLCEDMREVYPDLDLVVSTSHTEALPLVLLEAMACGLPVVATRVGGVPELLVQGETGWLVPPRDPETTALRMGELLAAPAERARMGAAARERVLDGFSLHACVDRTAQWITHAAHGRAEAEARPAGVRRMPE